MKKVMLSIFSVLAMTGTAFGAEVLSANLDSAGENILVNVRYGGCRHHQFALKGIVCGETFPAKCQAQLVDLTGVDACEAVVFTTAVFNLANEKLSSSELKRASLRISGDNNTSAVVILP